MKYVFGLYEEKVGGGFGDSHQIVRAPSMSYLYRGVSKQMDVCNDGRLCPKGNKSSVVMFYGDKGLKYDGKYTHGDSENNAARAHQIETGMHGGCYVSTSRSKAVAEIFATSDKDGNRMNGYVYVIDEKRLEAFGVVAWEFAEAEHPEQSEVSLRAYDNGDIPLGVVIKKYEVSVTDMESSKSGKTAGNAVSSGVTSNYEHDC